MLQRRRQAATASRAPKAPSHARAALQPDQRVDSQLQVCARPKEAGRACGGGGGSACGRSPPWPQRRCAAAHAQAATPGGGCRDARAALTGDIHPANGSGQGQRGRCQHSASSAQSMLLHTSRLLRSSGVRPPCRRGSRCAAGKRPVDCCAAVAVHQALSRMTVVPVANGTAGVMAAATLRRRRRVLTWQGDRRVASPVTQHARAVRRALVEGRPETAPGPASRSRCSVV